jgi:PBP1b-binding outer membrane lipoprotein LpoB
MTLRRYFQMKKMMAIVTGMAVLFASCVSLSDREMTAAERSDARVLGSVTAEFNSFQFFHVPNKKNLKNKAYLALKKAAGDKYEGNIDIRNITIAGSGSWLTIIPNVLPALIGGSPLLFTDDLGFIIGGISIGGGISLLSGNVQKITATGDVVLISGEAGTPLPSQLEGALNNAAEMLVDSMPQNATVAILSVYSDNRETAEYVIDELEYKLVNSRKFQIVDRRRLEQIRREQNFQLSGDVDDNSAVSIGNMLGATIVITGDISGSGSSRRLVLKALDVKTARIITMARERF